jgi:hypothetical protein
MLRLLEHLAVFYPVGTQCSDRHIMAFFSNYLPSWNKRITAASNG